jgi:predicted ATPase
MLLGWALAARREDKEGLGLLGEGLERHRSTGADMDRPYFLALLAEASIASGELEPARAALAEALGSTDNARPFLYEPELHRLRGELELRSGGDLQAAERHFHVGLEVARGQRRVRWSSARR